MSKAGQIEGATQNRIVQLFQQQWKYRYVGIWEDEKKIAMWMNLCSQRIYPRKPTAPRSSARLV
jgi:hypothetical protein